jgi:HK97 family phage major capsid protein
MSTTELTNKLNELSSNWEQFKIVNDRRLNEIEKKGSADPLTIQHIHNLNNKLDAQSQAIEQLQLCLKRPNNAFTNKVYKEISVEHKNAFCQYVRKGQGEDLLNKWEQKGLSAMHLADS